MKQQLQALGKVSDMILDLKLAELQNVTRQADQFQTANRDLDRAKSARDATLATAEALDPAVLTGQDQAWQTWMDQKRQHNNVALAKLYAEREGRMADARRALGRSEVIKTLLSQQK